MLVSQNRPAIRTRHSVLVLFFKIRLYYYLRMLAALGNEYCGGLPPSTTLANHDPRDTSKNNNGFRFQQSENKKLLGFGMFYRLHIQYGSTNELSFVKSRKVKVASCCFPFTSNLESPSAKLFQCHSLPPRRNTARMADLYVDLSEREFGSGSLTFPLLRHRRPIKCLPYYRRAFESCSRTISTLLLVVGDGRRWCNCHSKTLKVRIGRAGKQLRKGFCHS
jgi:hypothetical protein